MQKGKQSTNAAAVYESFDIAQNCFGEVNETEPTTFTGGAAKAMNTLNSSISMNGLHNTLDHSDLMNFLQKLSNWNSTGSLQIEVYPPKYLSIFKRFE